LVGIFCGAAFRAAAVAVFADPETGSSALKANNWVAIKTAAKHNAICIVGSLIFFLSINICFER
jgi:hypothetical protein